MKIYRYMDPANGEGDGGGGGDGKAKALTMEDIDKKIAGAVSGMAKRLEGKFEKSLEEMSTKSAAGIEELKALLTAKPPESTPTGGSKGKDSADDEKYNELKKNFDQLKLENEKVQKAAAQEKAAREAKELEIAQNEERGLLSKVLEEAGIKDARRAGAAAYLYLDQKKIKRNEKGEICFLDKDEYGDDALVPVDKGVKKWLSTEEGKAYLPAVESQGSGTRGGGVPGPRPGEKMTKQQAESILFSNNGIDALFGGGQG